MPISPQLKEAYDELESAILKVGGLNGWEGVTTEWILVAANQYYDDEGNSCTQISSLLPGGGDFSPHYRILGLLQYMTTAYKAEIATH